MITPIQNVRTPPPGIEPGSPKGTGLKPVGVTIVPRRHRIKDILRFKKLTFANPIFLVLVFYLKVVDMKNTFLFASILLWVFLD